MNNNEYVIKSVLKTGYVYNLILIVPMFLGAHLPQTFLGISGTTFFILFGVYAIVTGLLTGFFGWRKYLRNYRNSDRNLWFILFTVGVMLLGFVEAVLVFVAAQWLSPYIF